MDNNVNSFAFWTLLDNKEFEVTVLNYFLQVAANFVIILSSFRGEQNTKISRAIKTTSFFNVLFSCRKGNRISNPVSIDLPKKSK